MMASPEATETTAVANALSYPAWAMLGIKIRPSAATVAGPEPLTAPQKAATMTVAMAKPPVTSPTISLINFTMRDAIPTFSMIMPARMKKGMANSGTLAMPA